MKHVVIHQDRSGGGFFFHECFSVWTLRRDSHQVIVSRIITGSEPNVYYGTDDLEIRRRVDRLKERRIDRGEHFASGPLFSGVPRIGKNSDRLKGEDFKIVGELYYALAAEPRVVVVARKSEDGSDGGRQYKSVPGSKARWSDYLAAHHDKKISNRNKRLSTLLDELLTFCEPFSPGLQPTRREQFFALLTRRRNTKAEGDRAYYASARSLALELGAETLGVSVRNIKRRLYLSTQPGDYGTA